MALPGVPTGGILRPALPFDTGKAAGHHIEIRWFPKALKIIAPRGAFFAAGAVIVSALANGPFAAESNLGARKRILPSLPTTFLV